VTTVIAFALAAFFSALPWLISRHYAPRFAHGERVAVNWSLNGKPDYYASRRMALSLTPTLAMVSLLLMAGFLVFPPPAERLSAIAVIPFVGLVFAAIHAAHMHFAARVARNS